MKSLLSVLFVALFYLFTYIGPPPYLMYFISGEKLTKEEKKQYDQADAFFTFEKYTKASALYTDFMNKYPDDLYFKYRAGVCYLHMDSKRDEAQPILEEILDKAPKFKLAKYYLARALHYNYKFEEARDLFQNFIDDGAENDEERLNAKRYIRYCNNGMDLMEYASEIKVIPIKNGLNTEGSEYVPLISPDEKTMIFTYVGKKSMGGKRNEKGKPDENGIYYEDILISHLVDGNWSEPEGIADNINTDNHDAAMALSIDGQRLFIFQNNARAEADIFMSKLDGEDWTRPKKLKGDVNSEYWEGSASLSSDGRTLYFASNRPGGYGGRDLYKCTLQPDGSWGNVRNLGPTINTKENEDAPFIHPDNNILYFSSMGHECMGGYDIFYSFKEDGGWGFPENIGDPVSTPLDDRYYTVSADGKRGYFSTAAKGGKGKHDIYMIEPGSPEEIPELVLIKGVVLLDGQPTLADINLFSKATSEINSTYNSNEYSGKFSMVVNKGSDLTLIIKVEGQEPLEETVEAKDLDTYVLVNHVFKIYSEEYANLIGVKNIKNEPLQKDVNQAIIKQDIANKKAFNNVLALHGNDAKKGVTYAVELPKIEGYDYQELKAQGYKVKASPFKTNVYIVSGYANLNGANSAMQELAQQNKAFKNSRITVLDNGRRRQLEIYYQKDFNEILQKQIIAVAEKEQQQKEINENNSAIWETTIKKVDANSSNGSGTGHLDFSYFVEKNLNDKTIYKNLVEFSGAYTTEGLEFEVQIGAYQFPDNFKYPHLRKFGTAQVRNNFDTLTRFTMGTFNNLAKAEILRQRIIKAKQFDAWITPFYKGKRLLMQDLIAEDFYSDRVN